MSELRLFSFDNGRAIESHAAFFKLEREIQNLFEANLEALLGVRFVASEFSTGQGGRIDTLGIDENGFPVVIEYKLDKNRTVINQGMSYMAWLRSHKAEFWKVVFERLGKEVADSIDHSSTRLICIATDFTRDDLGAYELMPNNIDLVRYRRFGADQLLLERITTTESKISLPVSPSVKAAGGVGITQRLAEAPISTRTLYEQLRNALMECGDDVVEKAKVLYFAYRRTRTFATVTVSPQGELFVNLVGGFPDVPDDERVQRTKGGWGNADLRVRIASAQDIQMALPLLQRAYEGQS